MLTIRNCGTWNCGHIQFRRIVRCSVCVCVCVCVVVCRANERCGDEMTVGLSGARNISIVGNLVWEEATSGLEKGRRKKSATDRGRRI